MLVIFRENLVEIFPPLNEVVSYQKTQFSSSVAIFFLIYNSFSKKKHLLKTHKKVIREVMVQFNMTSLLYLMRFGKHLHHVTARISRFCKVFYL